MAFVTKASRFILSWLVISVPIHVLAASALSVDGVDLSCATSRPPASRTIRFAPDSARLNANAKKTIEEYGRFLRDCPEYHLVLVGYVSQGYGETYALAVSQRLADAVARELAALNVPESQVRPIGLGQTRNRVSKRGSVLLKLFKTDDGSNNEYLEFNIEIRRSEQYRIVIPRTGETAHSH